MGILKSIDKAIENGEKKYAQIKEDTKGIRRKGMQVVDYIIPPPKKKSKTAKCECPPKKKSKKRKRKR